MRILFVDDDEDVRAIAQLALGRFGGMDVQMCASGHEALEEGPGFRPDVIILDLVMPNFGGEETLEAMRALPALVEVPIVILTGRTLGPGDVERLASLGVVDVLQKPFDPMALPDYLTALVEGPASLDSTTNGNGASHALPGSADRGAAGVPRRDGSGRP